MSAAPATFVFCTCQPGAEQPLKTEVAARRPDWRLAFSRPGFVSFKSTQSMGAILDGGPPVFARTRSVSLGRVKNGSLIAAAKAVWELEGVRPLLDAHEVVSLHVWQRDSLLPGEDGFEPGVTAMAIEIKRALLVAAKEAGLESRAPLFDATVAPKDAVVLDVVAVEPDEWYVGWHIANSRIERWPGGMLPVVAPSDMVSRAYLKIEEAPKWSAIPASRGDFWVELGCAPGGASQALLNRGFHVIGVDPAEVDEPVASHPRFAHIRRRSSEVRRIDFGPAKWLAADLNVVPHYTLDAVEDVVKHPATSIRGLVLTLKLANWEIASPANLEEYLERVRSWGFRDVRLRQLVHNRHEICLVALHSRGQRRVKRARGRTSFRPSESLDAAVESDQAEPVRFDAPTQIVPPHHFR